jgi:hypothetical protein
MKLTSNLIISAGSLSKSGDHHGKDVSSIVLKDLEVLFSDGAEAVEALLIG